MFSTIFESLLRRIYPRLFALQRIHSQDVVWIRSIRHVENVPFNGDSRRTSIMETMIGKHSFQLGIESGTWVGNTTQWLVKHLPRVISIEYDKGLLGVANLRLGLIEHLELRYGPSEDILPMLINQHRDKCLFVYLDAHDRQTEPPLGKELAAISKHQNILVAIDDFRIPGTPFGFGTYAGVALDVAYLRRYVPNDIVVYGPSYPCDELTGKKRGWVVFAIGPIAADLHSNAKQLGLMVLHQQ